MPIWREVIAHFPLLDLHSVCIVQNLIAQVKFDFPDSFQYLCAKKEKPGICANK